MKTLAILLLCSFSSFSFASESIFYGEPDVGFTSGKIASSGTLAGTQFDTANSLSGFNGSLTLGWSVDYVHLLIAGRYSMLAASGEGGQDGTLMQGGIGLGWEWNIPMMTTISIEKGTIATEDDSLEAFGYRLGLSYFLSKRFKINVSATSMQASTDDVETKARLYMASVSFPFEIGYPTTWWREGGAR